eukprot:scaffold22058_cov73-Phaeocystis_antarctica.AAC.1
MAARSATSARSAAGAASLGAVASGEAGEVAGGGSLGSSPAAAARPAFFFLDFFEWACPLACSAASSTSGSSIAPSARACAACSARNGCSATAAACCGGAACCRMGSAVVVGPWALACRAVRCGRLGDRGNRAEHHREHHPGHSAQGDADAGCVLPEELRDGRVALHLSPVQGGTAFDVEQLGAGLGSQQGLHARLVPSGSGPHKSSVAVDVLQVDARSTPQQLPHHLQVAVACGGVQQGEVRAPTLASLGRVEDLDRQLGGRRAHRGLARGRLRRCCVLPDELRGGRLARGLGPPQGGAAVAVAQLGACLTLQQHLYARLLPSGSSQRKGGDAIAVL